MSFDRMPVDRCLQIMRIQARRTLEQLWTVEPKVIQDIVGNDWLADGQITIAVRTIEVDVASMKRIDVRAQHFLGLRLIVAGSRSAHKPPFFGHVRQTVLNRFYSGRIAGVRAARQIAHFIEMLFAGVQVRHRIHWIGTWRVGTDTTTIGFHQMPCNVRSYLRTVAA